VHSITFSAAVEDDQLGGKIIHSIIPFIKFEKLEDDPKFKKSVINELRIAYEGINQGIDLRPHIPHP